MRIRKNANLLSFMFSHASGPEALQTRVCQLNQSPWDVIPFVEDAYPWSLHQLEGEDSFNGNGSLGDSICAVESVVSMMEGGEERAVTIKTKTDNMVIDDNYEMERQRERKGVFEDYEVTETVGNSEKIHDFITLDKADGKGWHCKNEPKQGRAICDPHLTVLKSQTTHTVGNINNDGNNNAASCLGLVTPPSIKKPEKGIVTGARRGRPRAAAAKKGSSSSSSNPYEFYYYSGFGPLWGKRRGDKGEGHKNEAKDHYRNASTACVDPPAAATVSQDTTSSYSSEFDYGYCNVDYDEDDNVNGDSGSKKRMRKPVKARSLKSLM